MLGTDNGRSFKELFSQNEQRLKIIKDNPIMLSGNSN